MYKVGIVYSGYRCRQHMGYMGNNNGSNELWGLTSYGITECCRTSQLVVMATGRTLLFKMTTVPTRVPHGYGNTHGVSKTGNTGTVTVLIFGAPWHTIPEPAVSWLFMGLLVGSSSKFILVFNNFYWFFIIVFSLSPICHAMTHPNMAVQAVHTSLHPPPLSPCR